MARQIKGTRRLRLTEACLPSSEMNWRKGATAFSSTSISVTIPVVCPDTWPTNARCFSVRLKVSGSCGALTDGGKKPGSDSHPFASRLEPRPCRLRRDGGVAPFWPPRESTPQLKACTERTSRDDTGIPLAAGAHRVVISIIHVRPGSTKFLRNWVSLDRLRLGMRSAKSWQMTLKLSKRDRSNMKQSVHAIPSAEHEPGSSQCTPKTQRGRILVPIDFSENSRKAFKLAVILAADPENKLTVVQVLDTEHSLQRGSEVRTLLRSSPQPQTFS